MYNSIWRPIRHPVEDFPLAVCDASTVRQDRLIAADHVRRDYQGESYYPLYAAGYNWHYLSHQAEHEVLLFKTYDSKPDVAAVGKSTFGCPKSPCLLAFRAHFSVISMYAHVPNALCRLPSHVFQAISCQRGRITAREY
jgi:hypothetical protein